jgi:hypothetical protein
MRMSSATVAVLLTACGARGSGTAGSSGSGTTGSSGSATAGSNSSSTSGSSGGPTSYAGGIAFSTEIEGPYFDQMVIVEFLPGPPQVSYPDTCFPGPGHCVNISQAAANCLPMANRSLPVSGGPVSLSVNGAAWDTLDPVSSSGVVLYGLITSTSSQPQLWDPSTARASAYWTGKDVASGSGEVPLAEPVALTNAVIDGGSGYLIMEAKGRDLILTWSPGEAQDRVFVDVSYDCGDCNAPQLICQVADSDGTVTIPQAFLASELDSTANLRLSRTRDNEVVVANGTVSLNSSATTSYYVRP